ncbi:MAG: acetyl-CoA carboxylase biotin carboxyl carrier protein [Gemmatimonadetes bacterium]|nr:acetyl-CoA carboxylase biotin carboxyl carrier protein [Gemmatimonadota bacterium]
MLTFEQIKELIDIVCQKGLQGLEVERSDFRLRIDGQTGAATAAGTQVVAAPTASGSPVEQVEGESEEAGAEGDHMIASPIVGTFYSAPSPDSDPYVQVGDAVKPGQVLCIVEAMKLMNEIESDVEGTVVEVLGRNAQPIEYGEPLFIVRTT